MLVLPDTTDRKGFLASSVDDAVTLVVKGSEKVKPLDVWLANGLLEVFGG